MKKINAFTLAEVLITIAVIGILVILTVPLLKSDTDEKVLDTQKKAFNNKLSKGLHAMQVDGALADGYDTTMDFVSTMKKYMNVSKICDASHLDGCFAKSVLTEEKEEVFNMQTARKASDIKADFADDSDLAGVVFSDGTSAVIAYNTDCYIKDRYTQNEDDVDVKQCMSLVYDINGSKVAPNVKGIDVFDVNLRDKNDFDLSFAIKEVKSDVRNDYTSDNLNDAKAYCNSKGYKLISKSQMNELVSKLFEGCKQSGAWDDWVYYDSCNAASNPLWSKFTLDSNNYVNVLYDGGTTNIQGSSGFPCAGNCTSCGSYTDIICVK